MKVEAVNMEKWLIIVLFVASVYSQTDIDLPDDIPLCDRNGPNVTACLLSLTSEWTYRFRDGIEYLNVPPTDPLKLGRVSFVYDNGLIKGVFVLKKVKIFGISDMQVRNISGDYNTTNAVVEQEIFMPRIEFTGFYRAECNIGGIALKPNGFLNVTFYNVTLFINYEMEIIDRDNGYGYVNITTMKTSSMIDLFRLNATGISPDETINQSVLEFFNSKWREIYNALADDTFRIWQPYLTKWMNSVLSKLPIFKN